MRRSEFTGTREVFRFTLAQYLKSKSTIVTMIVMVVAVMASLLIAAYSMNSEGGSFSIESVFIDNKTDVALTTDDISAADSGIAGITSSASAENCDAVLTVENVDGAYIVKASGNDAAASDLSRLENAALTAFNTIRTGELSVSYSSRASSYENYVSPQEEGTDFSARFTVSYVFAVLVLVLVMLSSTYIIRSIIEEKATRLVETLMVSVKPLALILGKILASMCLVIIQLLMLAVGAVLATLASRYLLNNSTIIEMITSTGALSALTNINAFSIIAGVITVLLGFLTFSLIGGISGACCDNMNEINTANMAVIFTALAGYMVAMFVSGFEGQGIATVCSLIPIVSIFVAPVKFMSGQISLGVMLGAWALQIAVIALIAALCRKVYADLIIHRGSRVKLGTLLKMARSGGADK